MTITIRMGAAYHDLRIEENGTSRTFDLADMSKSDRHLTRRMLVGALTNAGVLNDKGGKFAVGRGKANARRKPRRHPRRAAV